jgi:HD-GYP domain-containing protein (c-di-GMP phosphodiesterase class II)
MDRLVGANFRLLVGNAVLTLNLVSDLLSEPAVDTVDYLLNGDTRWSVTLLSALSGGLVQYQEIAGQAALGSVEMGNGSAAYNAQDAMALLIRLQEKSGTTLSRAAEVSVMMTIFGRFLQLPQDRLEILGMLGLLQDVGMLKLPPELAVRGPANEAEAEIFRTHINHSVRILSDTPGLPPELPGLASLHHERFDGSGYPRGLRGDAIAFLGLIAGIVDTFDTLTAPKPLGEGLSPANALSIIYKQRGIQFHAALVEQFIQCVGVFPVGSVVELNSGEVAIVIAQNMVRRMQPRIMVVKDMNGNPLRPYKMLDLMKEPKVRPDEPYRIQRSLEYGSIQIDPRELFL